jgi:hypothetical protein
MRPPVKRVNADFTLDMLKELDHGQIKRDGKKRGIVEVLKHDTK